MYSLRKNRAARVLFACTTAAIVLLAAACTSGDDDSDAVEADEETTETTSAEESTTETTAAEELTGPAPGAYERTIDGSWETMRTFDRLPNLDWSDPEVRLVDLTGDGRADVLVPGDGELTWYPSLGENGFGPGEKVRQALDEKNGPRLLFADGHESIYLSDMSADGLNDLVRIRNGEVSYWPNLGYGRFGTRVVMDDSPRFDHGDQFSPSRIRLADIDGSGVTVAMIDTGVSHHPDESVAEADVALAVDALAAFVEDFAP